MSNIPTTFSRDSKTTIIRDSAASLFDSAFDSDNSSPINSSQESASCSEVTCSLTIGSTLKSYTTLEQSDDSDEETSRRAEYVLKPASFCETVSTTTTKQRAALFQTRTRKRVSPTSMNNGQTVADEYDFESQHKMEKKARQNNNGNSNSSAGMKSSKFFTSSRRKVVYSHNWSVESDEDKKIGPSNITVGTKINGEVTSFMGRIKQAQQCVESGELDDFRQELDYILSTLLDVNASQNLKHLSAIQLAKKCTLAEFRRFLRAQNVLSKIFAALGDCQGSPMIALTTAVIIYFLARDQKSVPVTDVSIRLMSDLLRQEQNRANAGDEFKKHTHLIWLIMKEWLSRCAERIPKAIHFGITEETLSASFLILEALAYISVREHNEFFKLELLNSGCLQWIIAKLDKAVLKLSYSPISEGTLLILEEIERCFRILENAAAFIKKNQAYLINHRNGLLLESGAKFLNYFKDFSNKFDTCTDDKSTSGKVLLEMLDCLCLLSRVFMNVSHENELCSKKLGQKDGFLHNCVNVLTAISPRIVPKDKFFDVCVMMYGLLVNLVERCNVNRQKLLEFEVSLYDIDNKAYTSTPVLAALTKLFVKHDLAARTLDEELDNDLAFEEPIEDEEASNQEAAVTSSSTQQSINSSASLSQEVIQNEHRLQRPVELSEDEMLNAVQGAMNKASAHMEDSMLASYVALLVGCMIQTDEELADSVKALLSDNNLGVMIEQLERFLEFMKLTKMKAGATRSIERIIQSLQLLL